MRYYGLLLSITVVAFFLAQTDAKPIDPLDPSRLGESMSIQPSQEPVSLNVTGAWSFDLMGKTPEKVKLYLTQNEEAISGSGIITQGKESKKVIASGCISGDRMSLAVAPEGSLDQYRLNLSFSSLAAGTYTACLADGSCRSGKTTFTVFANIFKDANIDEDDTVFDDHLSVAMPS